MKEEFNLSEKEILHSNYEIWIKRSDVKEFIKKIKKMKIVVPVWKGRFTEPQREYIDLLIKEFGKRQNEQINKLAGDKLK